MSIQRAIASVCLALCLPFTIATSARAGSELGTTAGWATSDGANQLDLVVLLNTQHPQFKRDLNGVTVLGEGAKTVISQLGNYQVAFGVAAPQGARNITVADVLEKSLGGNYESINMERSYQEQNYPAMQQWLNVALQRILDVNKIRRAGPTAVGWTGDSSATGPLILLMPRFVATAASTRTTDRLGEFLTPVGMVKASRDLKYLADPRYQSIGTIEVAALLRMAGEAKQAAENRGAQMKQLQEQWFAAIEKAAGDGSEVVAAIAPQVKAGGYKPEEVTLCVSEAKDTLAARGLLASEGFIRWSGRKAPVRVDSVFKTPEELYSAAQAGKCALIVDYAPNLQRYIQALKRDGKPVIIGLLMTRAEAQEPFAKSMGYTGWADLNLARTLGSGGGASAQQLEDLRRLGIDKKPLFDQAAARMSQSGYDKAPDPNAGRVLQFLADEAEGRKAGQTAVQYRTAANAKSAAEAKAREDAERRAIEAKAKEFPFEAIISCGTPNHINILACFAGGSHGVDTELKLKNGEQSGMYKAYNFNQSGGREQADGYHIDLRQHFSIKAQNSQDTLILSVKVIDRKTGKVMFSDQAAKFGVISVGN